MKAKEKRGSIDFDMPESKILFTETGDPYDVVPYERHLAHRIIEEFMIIANETVARYMFEKGYPFIYRTHEEYRKYLKKCQELLKKPLLGSWRSGL